MKKISLIIVLLLILPLAVLAEEEEFKVLTLTTEVDGANINYSGTTEEGSHAVMCKLYDADNEEIDMLSSAVEEEEFSASFVVTEEGDYTVSCANYSGGEFKTATATVGEVKNANNPNTYDAGIKSILVLIVSVVGMFGCAL